MDRIQIAVAALSAGRMYLEMPDPGGRFLSENARETYHRAVLDISNRWTHATDEAAREALRGELLAAYHRAGAAERRKAAAWWEEDYSGS